MAIECPNCSRKKSPPTDEPGRCTYCGYEFLLYCPLCGGVLSRSTDCALCRPCLMGWEIIYSLSFYESWYCFVCKRRNAISIPKVAHQFCGGCSAPRGLKVQPREEEGSIEGE